MHYTERQIAITNLHDALERRGGWNIVGYWPRDNDPYADYPKPASWDGLATKDGATLVVDRGDLTKSGWERAVNERTDGETCKVRIDGLKAKEGYANVGTLTCK